jgi:hypothetical protein
MLRIEPELPMLRTLPRLKMLPTLPKLRMLNKLLALSGPARLPVLVRDGVRPRLDRTDLRMADPFPLRCVLPPLHENSLAAQPAVPPSLPEHLAFGHLRGAILAPRVIMWRREISAPEGRVDTESRSIESVIRGIKESTYEIQTESRLAYSGLKREQNIAGVLRKYAWLYDLETVRRAEEAYRAETDPVSKERLRRVYYHLIEGCLGQRTAPLEDELVSFEAGATVEVDGESIPYHNVPVLIATEHDFEKRDRLWEASLAVVKESNPKRLDILRIRLAMLAEEFGYARYTAYNAEKKRIDYNLLRTRMDDLLSKTEETYATLMGRWVEETTSRKLGEIGSHHFSYISRVPKHDEHFRKDKLLESYGQTLTGLGLDPASQKNIHIDTAERPTKNPRARCYAPDPPGRSTC